MDMWSAPVVQSRQPLTYVDGKHGSWGPKITWKQLTDSDCRERRSGVRSTMRAASQLPGRGPTDVDVDLLPAR